MKTYAIQAMRSIVLLVMEETRFVELVKIVPEDLKEGPVNVLLT